MAVMAAVSLLLDYLHSPMLGGHLGFFKKIQKIQFSFFLQGDE
jgi:hypothetical protein